MDTPALLIATPVVIFPQISDNVQVCTFVVEASLLLQQHKHTTVHSQEN